MFVRPRNVRLASLTAALVLLSGCWTQIGAGPGKGGWNRDEKDLLAANVAGLEQAWSVDLGTAAVNDPLISSYGVHATTDQGTTTRHRGNGAVRWTRPATQGGVETPTLDGSRLLVVEHEYPGAFAHHLDAATGESLGETDFTSTAPVTVGGGVRTYEVIERLQDVIYGRFLVIRHPSEPDRSWSTIQQWGESGAGSPDRDGPVVGRGLVYSHGGAYPFDEPAGCTDIGNGTPWCQPLWSIPTLAGGGAYDRPVLSADAEVLYVAQRQGAVSAVDAQDGTLLWRASLGRQVVAPPTVGEGRVFVPASDGTVFALPANGCGQPTCAASVLGTAGRTVSEQAALAGGVLYVAAGDGTVKAFPAAGCGAAPCAPRWQVDTGAAAITGAPAVALGDLVVGTADGRLIAYRVPDGG